MTKIDLDRPVRHTWRNSVSDFFAFEVRGRYFWVRPVEGGCGPVFGTLVEAIREALLETAHSPKAAAVYSTNAAIEILEVRRRDRYRRVWCSDPTLLDAPIKTRPEPGVDFFPPEWVTEAKLAARAGSDARAANEHPIANPPTPRG